MMAEQDFDLRVCERLGLDPHERDMADWEGFLAANVRAKIASFTDVDVDCVFTCEDAPSIYDVPRMMAEQDFDLRVCERLGLDPHERDMADWEGFLAAKDHAENEGDPVKIALVGKYTQLPDAYLSVIEAARRVPLRHRGAAPRGHAPGQARGGRTRRWRGALR